MSKKAAVVIGGIAGLIGLSWLISKTLAKPATVQVAVRSHPIPTAILVDDKLVPTPKTILLTKGKHKFSAVTKSPDLMLTYGFDKWTISGWAVSRSPTVELNITQPIIITANYLVSEAGIYPIIA